jgi:hypothetical protein
MVFPERQEELELCKKTLEKFFLESQHIPIETSNLHMSVDGDIVDYLTEAEQEHLIQYVHPVLDSFQRARRVFDGKAGKFTVEARYAQMSARYYVAIKAD